MNDYQKIFDKEIKCNLLNTEEMNHWHEQLKLYVENEDSNFFVIRRLANSGKKGNENRRGMKMLINNITKVVYCDNSFVWNSNYYFRNNKSELKDFINKLYLKEIPIGAFYKGHEFANTVFKFGRYQNFGSDLKLAHIFSVNKNEYSYEFNSVKNKLYPIGKLSDWANEKKMFETKVEFDYKKIVVSNFITMIHPINHVILPSKYKKISEKEDFLNFIFQEYCKIYDQNIIYDFLKWSLINNENPKIKNLSLCNEKIDIFKINENIECGKLAKSIFEKLSFEKKMKSEHVLKLENSFESKNIFKLATNYPILAEKRYKKIKHLYYKNPFVFNKKKYYLINQWKEENKENLIHWYNSLI